MADFFKKVDEDATVEQHAKQVQTIQKDQAADMVDVYREAKRDLIDRLSRARYDSFTAQSLRGVLAQVDAALRVMHEKLKDGMQRGSNESATEGAKHLLTEIRKFAHKFTGAVQPINLDVVKVGLDTSNLLINQYDVSIKRYDADVRAKIGRGLTQAAVQELPYTQVIGKLSQFFTGQEWELHRIVRTELHHTYSLAKFQGMKTLKKDTLPDLKKALYHPMDSRTGQDSIELAEMNPILPLEQAFKQTYTPIRKDGSRGKPQHYVFMVPPDRPNDRAILIPYRDAWDE